MSMTRKEIDRSIERIRNSRLSTRMDGGPGSGPQAGYTRNLSSKSSGARLSKKASGSSILKGTQSGSARVKYGYSATNSTPTRYFSGIDEGSAMDPDSKKTWKDSADTPLDKIKMYIEQVRERNGVNKNKDFPKKGLTESTENDITLADGGEGSGPPLGNQNAYKGASQTEDSKEFVGKITAARESQPAENRWRVDIHDASDYDNDKLYTTEGGSTYALDGKDIVSVYKNADDKGCKGKQLLADAVKNGGSTLDSYEGNHGFYTACGFEPVSWCKWNDDYAPDAWKEANSGAFSKLGLSKDDDSWKSAPNSALDVKREDIIFYKYTGNKSTESASDFKNRVAGYDDYDEAKDVRDRS